MFLAACPEMRLQAAAVIGASIFCKITFSAQGEVQMGMRIAGCGMAAPERIVTNDDLAKLMDTSDEWISTRTGIRRRHVLSGSEELAPLGAAAAKKAIANSGLEAQQIDLCIVTTVAGDYKTPSMSCLISGMLGLHCITLDINMACCSFIYALNTAWAYLSSGLARNALVISAESMTRLSDWNDRSTCVLFGDGSGAVVLTLDEDRADPVFDLKAEGSEGWRHLYSFRQTGNSPFLDETKTGGDGFLHMDGQDIYKFAVSSVCERVRGVMEKAGVNDGDVGAYLLHQANLRIMKSAAAKLGGAEKFLHNIEEYGNTSSASIPILLAEKCADFKRGEKIIMCAFGAGLSSAACLLEW